MIGKKKQAPAVENATTLPPGNVQPRSMFYYFIPSLVMAVVLVSALVAGQSWLSEQNARARLDQSAKLVANTVQKYVGAVIQGKSELVAMFAGESLVKEALRNGEQAMLAADAAIEARLPDVLSVKLLPAEGWDDAKVQTALFGSYAAADMFQRVRAKAAPVPIEALKSADGKTYFLIAMPVKEEGKLAGVLFATFPFKLVSAGLKDLRTRGVGISLEQDTGMPLVTLGSPISKASGGKIAVPGTLWHVTYSNTDTIALSLPILLGLALVAICLLMLVIIWGYRRLRKDYQVDMGMTVTLVDATLKRMGTTARQPHLLESVPAIEMLTRYAQATRMASVDAEHRENKAGQTQMTVGDLEKENAEVAHEVCEVSPEQLPESLFRENVIRGLSGTELNAEIAQAVGLIVGSMVQENGGDSLLVGRDNRPASSEYSAALIAGVLATGCDVVDAEVAPMPLLSFGTRVSPNTSAVMVTGGHNQPDVNGFKIIIDGQPLAQQQLMEIRERILSGNCKKGVGQLTLRDMGAEYVHSICEDVQLVDSMKVVLDCGNGIAGSLAIRLLEELGCEVIPLFCEPDGSFPNHLADPADVENLTALSIEVQAREADLGIALDVDGDALAVVDEKGRVIATDELIMKLGRDIVHRHPGADVIYDVACSANLPAMILASGGRPIMWKTGHGSLQHKLAETGGVLAGEMSGHIYIQERWYGFDDGLYAAARLLEMLSLESIPVSEAFADYQSAFSTPLMQVETPQGRAEQIISAMRVHGDFTGADIVELDGLRVEYTEAWGLARASKTQPGLVFRFEASNEEALAEIEDRFRTLLGQVAPELPLPF